MKVLERLPKSFTILVLLALCTAFIVIVPGCNNLSSQGRATVKMTDDPSNFDAMIVNIDRIEVHKSGTGSNGWEVLSDQPTRVNLLSLTNGQTSLLGSSTLAAGSYDQLRLILGSGNSIVDQGTSYALSIPSGLQTGIKININLQVKDGQTSNVLLDFNAAQSVITSGVGIYILQPVIRSVNMNSDGNIKGTISPGTLHSYVMAYSQEDTVSTFADTTNGSFKIVGLSAGTYNVHFYAGSRAYNDTTITGVEVNAGNDTNMGTITLHSSGVTASKQ